jgi:ABC-type transporter Mla subunit MlaD
MSNALKLKVGLMVVGTAVLGVFVDLWLRGGIELGESIPVVTYFSESIVGLSQDSKVTIRGLPLGKVDDVSLAPDRRHVEVRVSLLSKNMDDETARMFKHLDRVDWSKNGLRLRMVSQGLSGRKYLDIDFVEPRHFPPEPLPFDPPKNYIPSATSTMSMLEERAAETLDSIQSAAGTAERILKESDLPRTSKSLQETAAAMTRAVGDVQKDLQSTLVEMDRTLKSVRSFVNYLERNPNALIYGRNAK